MNTLDIIAIFFLAQNRITQQQQQQQPHHIGTVRSSKKKINLSASLYMVNTPLFVFLSQVLCTMALPCAPFICPIHKNPYSVAAAWLRIVYKFIYTYIEQFQLNVADSEAHRRVNKLVARTTARNLRSANY